MPLPLGVNPPDSTFKFPSIEVDTHLMQKLTQQCIDHGVMYGLGKKIHPLGLEPGQFTRTDCSGFSRWLLWRCTMPRVDILDGSWHQKAWFDQHGFKETVFESGHLKDNILRVAFLSPQDGLDGIGHVAFVLNGHLLESHGSTGPDNKRAWGSRPWMSSTRLFVVTHP